VIYLIVDDAGRAWFGTRDNGVIMLDGERRRNYGAADGIALGAVTFVDASREPVISGDNGAAVWQAGRFRLLRAEGADLSNVSGLAVTGNGDRWLNTKRGLLHVTSADWQRSMADPMTPLRGRLLDELDGFPGEGNANSPVSTLRVGADGRLWIGGTDGVSILEPARARGATAGPQAQIMGFVADGRSYRTGPPPLLAPRTERLGFDFTAPSLTTPERVRFRYRLAGFDHAWLDAGAVRSASYTNLAPGEYRFEVQAMNDDGNPGPVASTPSFRIAPAFYQTGWFTVLCMLLAGLLAWLLYRWRLGRIQRAWQNRMEERVSERERIARALHDTFLQSLHGLILRFDAVAVSLPPDSKQRAQMEHLLEVASRVSEEGRSQVMDLRTAMPRADLQAALMASIAELRTAQNVEVSFKQIGEPRELSAEVRQEVEAVAREAIANVFRHAEARHLDLAIDWTGKAMVLTIVDDGVGIPPSLLKHGRAGHWGLRGMRERAARIGASLTLRNRNRGGLEVRLNLGGSWAANWRLGRKRP